MLCSGTLGLAGAPRTREGKGEGRIASSMKDFANERCVEERSGCQGSLLVTQQPAVYLRPRRGQEQEGDRGVAAAAATPLVHTPSLRLGYLGREPSAQPSQTRLISLMQSHPHAPTQDEGRGRTEAGLVRRRAVRVPGAYGGLFMRVQARETINKAVTHCGV